MTDKEKLLDLEIKYNELKKQYDELNNWHDSQLMKALEQIEKMKRCANCNYYASSYCDSDPVCKERSKWEMMNDL